jgi:hypothetical protein
LRKYKNNLKLYRKDADFDNHIDNIGGAFIWADTKEGQGYWSELEREWEIKKSK